MEAGTGDAQVAKSLIAIPARPWNHQAWSPTKPSLMTTALAGDFSIDPSRLGNDSRPNSHLVAVGERVVEVCPSASILDSFQK